MQEGFGVFGSCVDKAEASKLRMKFALVWPDEGTVEVAQRAKSRNLAVPLAFSAEPIEGIETRPAKSPQEAVEMALASMLSGEVDTLMKGLVNTCLFLKAIVKSSIRTGYVTHCSVLGLPGIDFPVVITDGTVTPFPDLAQKAEITKNAVRCARLLGRSPARVAVLSANELVLPGFPSGNDAAALREMGERGQIGGAIIDGPMALDSALSKKACEKKGLSFAFDPPADVLVCPDLESAAMLIKSAVHLAGAQVAGILWGTRNPIVLTSRADTEEAKYVSLCLCKLAMEAP